jgi:hypothetical protein
MNWLRRLWAILTRAKGLPNDQDKISSITESMHEVPPSSEENPQIATVLGNEVKAKHSVSSEFCIYHFGYLNEGSRDKKIPEQCLTCGKTIECMLFKEKSETAK